MSYSSPILASSQQPQEICWRGSTAPGTISPMPPPDFAETAYATSVPAPPTPPPPRSRPLSPAEHLRTQSRYSRHLQSYIRLLARNSTTGTTKPRLHSSNVRSRLKWRRTKWRRTKYYRNGLPCASYAAPDSDLQQNTCRTFCSSYLLLFFLVLRQNTCLFYLLVLRQVLLLSVFCSSACVVLSGLLHQLLLSCKWGIYIEPAYSYEYTTLILLVSDPNNTVCLVGLTNCSLLRFWQG